MYNLALEEIKGDELYQSEIDKYTEDYLEYIQEKVYLFDCPIHYYN